MTTPSRVSMVIAEALVMLMTALVGCTSDGEDRVASPAISDPSAQTVSPAEEQARREILAAYDGYLEAYIEASASADYRTRELAQFVAEPLLGQLLNNLYNMARSNVKNEGRPNWSPTVTELRMDAGQAVIEDCFDSTHWNAVGGKTPPTSQAKRYPVVLKAKRVSGKWYVHESTADRNSTC